RCSPFRSGVRGADSRADDRRLVARRHDLKRASLQRTHLHHLVQVYVEQVGLYELRVRAGDEELAGAADVYAVGRGGGERAVPQLDELDAARVALAGVREDLFGFEVEEAQTHRASAHDALEVARAAAAAEALLRVERDDRVAVLPDAFGQRVAPEADAAPQGPHAHERAEVAARRGYSGGDCVRVVDDEDGGADALVGEKRLQLLAESLPLHLL